MPYLNTADAAAYLRVSKQLLERWRMQRTGPPYVKIGGAIRYSAAALDAWMEEHTVQPVVATV